MIDPALAKAILNPRTANIGGAFQQGNQLALSQIAQQQAMQDRKREMEDRRKADEAEQLAGQALKEGGGLSLQKLFELDPKAGMDIQNRLGIRDQQEFDQFLESARIGENFLKDGMVNEFISFAEQRANAIDARGGNSTQTRAIIEKAKRDPAAALEELNNMNSAFQQVSDQISVSQREFEYLTEGLSQEEKDKARRIRLGLDSKATNRLSPEELAEIERLKVLSREGTKSAVKAGGEAFGKLDAVGRAINNLDRAIAEIDKGAETGTLSRFLPTFRESTKRLEQIRRELGLDVVALGNFGALSESELNLALDTGIDLSQEPQALKKDLQARKAAQEKVRDALEQAAIFLSNGGTISELVQQGRDKRMREQQAQTQAQTQPQAQPQTQAQPDITVDDLMKELQVKYGY